MKSGKGFVVVKYDHGHMRGYEIGDVKLEIAREVNNDLKAGSDQKATIVAVSDDCTWLKEGDVVWTHYLASGSGSEFTHNGVKYNRIKEDHIFFKIKEDGELEVANNVYLCKDVIKEADKTESGIYLTPFEEKKQELHLEVLYAPHNYDGIEPGDTIIIKDDNNYTIMYNKEELIKIDYQFILAKYEKESA